MTPDARCNLETCAAVGNSGGLNADFPAALYDPL